MISMVAYEPHKMKGFAFVGLIAIGGILVLIFMFASLFSGGGVSSGCGTLLCWGDTPILSGIDFFITGIANLFIYVSLWVTIGVLGLFLIGLQIVFIYFYYRIFSWLWQFREAAGKVIDELLDI